MLRRLLVYILLVAAASDAYAGRRALNPSCPERAEPEKAFYGSAPNRFNLDKQHRCYRLYQRHDKCARAVLRDGNDAHSWRCTFESNGALYYKRMNLDTACKKQYGPFAKAELLHRNNADGWYCKLPGSMKLGHDRAAYRLDLSWYCREIYSGTSRAEHTTYNGEAGWFCVNPVGRSNDKKKISLAVACVVQYGRGARLRQLRADDSSAWYCSVIGGGTQARSATRSEERASRRDGPLAGTAGLRLGQRTSRAKRPAADRGTASLLFLYYGDSKFKSLFQETVKLKLAMEGYDSTVLLKHNDVVEPFWDLAERDERLANIKDLPTRRNFIRYLRKLVDSGYLVDIWIFSHGAPGQFLASTGRHGSVGWITSDDIGNLADAMGYAYLPIRLVYQINCYGNGLARAWRRAGAKSVTGSRYINFFPNQFGKFARLWNRGRDVATALQRADNGASRTVAHAYILTHARGHRNEWGGCPFPRTVLGRHRCARKYFDWWELDALDWPGKSGKYYMYYASQKLVSGDARITKRQNPWSASGPTRGPWRPGALPPVLRDSFGTGGKGPDKPETLYSDPGTPEGDRQ